MKKTMWTLIAAVAVACFSGVTANAGVVYNANNEFKAYDLVDTTYEPSFGNFTVGTGATLGAFTPFGTGNKAEAFFLNANLQGWNETNATSTPFVIINTSASAVTPSGFSISTIAPSEIVMHGSDTVNAVLRFTATVSGAYNITGAWHSLDSGITENYVLKNGTSLFNSIADNPSFNLATTLLVGDTIDFVVNNYDGFGYDSTGLFAQLELVTVPEPTTMTLLALGGIGLVGLARRKRKTNVVA